MNDNLIYVFFRLVEGYVVKKTISRHTISVADSLREQTKELLLIPLKEKVLTICPDYWTESYKKISYLGVTVTIVDDQYNYKSIDFCCRPFQHRKKAAVYTFNINETVVYNP